MPNLVALLLAMLCVLAVTFAAQRALVIFEIRIHDGRVTRARGRIPQRLLHDLLAVCPRGLDSKLVVQCRSEQGRARVVVAGSTDEDTIQRMRNLVGLWPLARLKTAPRVKN